jgi:hypothetical protein
VHLAMLNLADGPRVAAESPAINVVALARSWDILRPTQCLPSIIYPNAGQKRRHLVSPTPRPIGD